MNLKSIFLLLLGYMLIINMAQAQEKTISTDEDTSLSITLNRLGMSEFWRREQTDSNIISISLLSKYIPNFSGGEGRNETSYYAQNSSILMLFQFAYGDGDWTKFGPGLVPGKTKFITTRLAEFDAPVDSGEGAAYTKWRSMPGRNWNYFVKVPPSDSSIKVIYKTMKSELAKRFPYISVKIQKQIIPVWILRQAGDNNLYKDDQSKKTIKSFLNQFQFMHQHEVIVNETNYAGGIKEIPLTKDFGDMNFAANELNKIGLKLIKGTHEEDILILTDMRSSNN